MNIRLRQILINKMICKLPTEVRKIVYFNFIKHTDLSAKRNAEFRTRIYMFNPGSKCTEEESIELQILKGDN